ncbi:LVIVD repeat-containing protein [Haloferax sp. S1W]|uniref:LVIVD repeat-containing protein n=1 Tax=Haloferax sp. S1W TaxID=3377110 RepID=UPI0037C995A3
MTYTRRTALKLIGATTLGSIGTTTVAADPGGKKDKGAIRKLGHSLLSDPAGGYAEEDIRSDGQYAILGSFTGPGGSFLVDISNPTDPTEVHEFPTPSNGVRHADVKFDRRDGLYYRSREGGDDDPTTFAPPNGVDVIDYGWSDGTPENPVKASRIPAGSTHNVRAHPEADVLYTTEHHGVGVWDTSDPTNVTGGDVFGPEAALHDMVVDPGRDLLHCAFIGGGFDGYVIMDISDPMEPEEVGRFSYEGLPSYEDVAVGEEGFENCHYANFDPNRELAYVGDEIGFGKPGGKHVFDIGWGDGSIENPKPIGYTTSPNAEVMDEALELFDWTGHNFDIIPKGRTTMLVSGDYHEGAVVYDVSDPTDPTATDQYRTDDMADQANGAGFVGPAPMAWGVDYADERDFTVVSDMQTGIYVFKFTPSAAKGD